MKDERLPKRAETKKQGGCRKRGRKQLIWEDCLERDLRKVGEEEKGREKANNRERWKKITRAVVQKNEKREETRGRTKTRTQLYLFILEICTAPFSG